MQAGSKGVFFLASLPLVCFSSMCLAALPQGRFTDPKPVAGIDLNSEIYPVISPSGLELYFTSDSGSNQDIWVASRSAVDVPFESVARVSEVNSSAGDNPGSASADGLTLYFGSGRRGNYDMFQATRPDLDSPFQDITDLGSGVVVSALDNMPFVSPDGMSLYYHRSNTPGSTNQRLWTATRDNFGDSFANAMDLGNLVNGSPTIDSWKPSVSSDGLTLFFSDGFFGAPRPGGVGAMDVWISHRETLDDPFGEPINLNNAWPGTQVNTASMEGMASISADWPAAGSKLYYGTLGNGGGDIWEATWVPEFTGPEVTFGTPERVGPPISVSGRPEYFPSLSTDALTMYFVPDTSSQNDIYISTRATTSDAWATPRRIEPGVLSGSSDGGPDISYDGLTLLFQSDRPGGRGQLDIWMSTRESVDAPWQRPVNMEVLNSPVRDSEPFLSADGLSLYFDRSGPGWGAIFVTTRENLDAPWGEPVRLGPEVNRPGTSPGVMRMADNGLVRFFSADRADGYYEIFMQTRPHVEADWGDPELLDASINSAGSQYNSDLASDGYFYFGRADAPEAWSTYDFWRVPYEMSARAPGEFNGDNELTVDDIDLLSSQVRRGSSFPQFDLNADGNFTQADRDVWVKELKGTWFGDANLDGEFNSSDLTMVFAEGKYETLEAAGWAEGDWDGSGRFDTGDLIKAFADGGYEQGPAPAAVPEPSTWLLAIFAMASFLRPTRVAT
jgi:Tol biopolymer transport system component